MAKKKGEEERRRELDEIEKELRRVIKEMSPATGERLADLCEKGAELYAKKARLTEDINEQRKCYSAAAGCYKGAVRNLSEEGNSEKIKELKKRSKDAGERAYELGIRARTQNARVGTAEQNPAIAEETAAEEIPETAKKVPAVQQLRDEIASLKNQRSNSTIGTKTRMELSTKLGEDYQRLGDLSENYAAANTWYLGGAKNFAEAGKDAKKIGEERQASKAYMHAARMYKKLGDSEKTSLYAHKARAARRIAIRGGLEKINGIHIFILFILAIFFSVPRFTGNVIGASLKLLDYLSLVFFILFVITLSLKLYARKSS